MEKTCKLIFFGDSLLRDCYQSFKYEFRRKYPEVKGEIIDQTEGGETSGRGLKRLSKVVKQKPDVVVISYGMNDQERGVSRARFTDNLIKMVDRLQASRARVLLMTLNPGSNKSAKIREYNQVIQEVACRSKIRLIDIYSYWQDTFGKGNQGFKDNAHYNKKGKRVYVKALMEIIPRRNTVILWQYNGNPCECNYNCPHCPYDPKTQSGHHFFGTISQWRRGFKKVFGNQHLVFYFGHGEPMIGKKFFDVVKMIGEEPNWEMRIISNISGDLKKLVNSRVAKEGRLNVNASFHPTQTTRKEFLRRLLYLRNYDIETPVVYTMWPPFFKRFKQDFEIFSHHDFLVHVRRFRGYFKNKFYPVAYTDEERIFIAQYADDATIKYMLNDELTTGKRSYTGMYLILVDNVGNIGYCDDAPPDKNFIFGNIFKNTVNLLKWPERFHFQKVSDGTVDGVANILELGYKELEANHIIHFANQGGVYRDEKGKFHYSNLKKDFKNSKIRAEYRLPPRNLKDLCFTLVFSKDPIERIRHFLSYNLKYQMRNKARLLSQKNRNYLTLLYRVFARILEKF